MSAHNSLGVLECTIPINSVPPLTACNLVCGDASGQHRWSLGNGMRVPQTGFNLYLLSQMV